MGSGIRAVTTETWRKEVEEAGDVVVAYFWAPWCNHCKMFMPTFEELAESFAGVCAFVKVNCDENMDLARRCDITGTPTILVYKDGKAKDRIVGGQPKAQVAAKIGAVVGAAKKRSIKE